MKRKIVLEIGEKCPVLQCSLFVFQNDCTCIYEVVSYDYKHKKVRIKKVGSAFTPIEMYLKFDTIVLPIYI